ncbi:MAG: hypothetical protein PWP14_1725 [Methanolobus sp.]|nr:hypothetical protein [Methanolobus sp.]
MKDKEISRSDLERMIQSIHASPYMLVLSVTGGGAGAIGELLRHGGGSATLLEAVVPYHENALRDYIGKEPERYCSGDTAREMAMAAFRRALELAGPEGHVLPDNIIGIAATCKLSRSEERSGRAHEIHFASQSLSATSTIGISLLEDRSREEEEELASDLMIHVIARLCGIASAECDSCLSHAEQQVLEQREVIATHDQRELLLSILQKESNYDRKSILVAGNRKNGPAVPGIVFSGSFNPCHKNHAAMAKVAYERYGVPVTFEISLANVDKPPIDFISLEDRLSSLKIYGNEAFFGDVYLTNAPLFADKAMLFPGCSFLIGSDTFNRIFNEKYYREGEDKLTLLEHFRKYSTRFLVFHRQDVELAADKDVLEICDIIPLDTYNDDGTSSRKLRRDQG